MSVTIPGEVDTLITCMVVVPGAYPVESDLLGLNVTPYKGRTVLGRSRNL